MNKFLIYTVIAILLGTITMITPLVILESNDQIHGKNYADTNPGLDSESTEYSDMVVSPEEPNERLDDKTPVDSSPEEPQSSDTKLSLTDPFSGLSSIALMIIPSFLIALGVFVYHKKQTG